MEAGRAPRRIARGGTPTRRSSPRVRPSAYPARLTARAPWAGEPPSVSRPRTGLVNTHALDVSRSAAHSKSRGLYVGAVGVAPRRFAVGGHEVDVREAWVERGTRVWERLVASWEASQGERSALADWLTRPHPPEDARPAPPFVLAFMLASATLSAGEGADASLVWDHAPGRGAPVRAGHVYAEPLRSPLPAGAVARVRSGRGGGPGTALRFALPTDRAGPV